MTGFLLKEGWEKYSQLNDYSDGMQGAGWTVQNSEGLSRIDNPGQYNYGRCYHLDATSFGGQCWLEHVIPSQTSISVGIAINLLDFEAGSRAWPFFGFTNGGSGQTQICGLGMSATAQPYFWIGHDELNAVVMANTVFSTSAWHYVELELDISSNGNATIFIDGFADGVYHGNTGLVAADSITVGPTPAYGPAWDMDFDNLYVRSGSTRYGERRVIAYAANSDVVTQWTANSGTLNFAMANGIPVPGQPTNFNYSNTVGFYDLYGVQPLSGNPSEIDEVSVTICVAKDNPDPRQVATLINSGGTQVQGNTLTLTGSYLFTQDSYETDPNTGLAWTANAVRAVEIGQIVVT